MTSPFGVDARPSPEYVATPADLNGGKTEDPANTDLSKFDEQNVYFKGLQNLGLGSVLSEGLIDLHSLTPSTAITNNTVSYDNAVTRLRGKPVGYPSIITPPTGQKSDLESLDYYNIPSASNSGRKNSAGKPLPPPLPHQQYDWQSPTFGLEESTTRNLRSSRLQWLIRGCLLIA